MDNRLVVDIVTGQALFNDKETSLFPVKGHATYFTAGMAGGIAIIELRRPPDAIGDNRPRLALSCGHIPQFLDVIEDDLALIRIAVVALVEAAIAVARQPLMVGPQAPASVHDDGTLAVAFNEGRSLPLVSHGEAGIITN